jgi:hypothetical protein
MTNPLYETVPSRDLGKCYCGNPAQKISSGSPECWRCWDWRKIGADAARYWSKAIDHLFVNENGSGPDPNDWELWDRWGMRESMTQALYALRAVQQAYDEMLANPRPWSVKE